MKYLLFITLLLLATSIGYTQVYYIWGEDFHSGVLPNNWDSDQLGTGTQEWTFGSNHVPAINGATDFDFASNAAIFNDDAAGDGGQHDKALLFYPKIGGLLDVSQYTNSIIKLQYHYALNVTTPGSEALHIVVLDNNTYDWIILETYDTDTLPIWAHVNISDAIADNPGIDSTDLVVGFMYDDIDSDWAWGAGIENIAIFVEAENQFCNSAIPVTVYPEGNGCTNPTTANNYGAVSSEVANGTPSCGAFNGGDIWYSFVAPNSGGIKITLPNGSQDWSSMNMSLYNDCSETTEITCRNTTDTEVIEDLTPGNTYLLRLWDYNNDDFGDLDFCIEENNTAPSNDEADHPILLVIEPVGSSCNNPTLMYNTFATDSSPINGTPSCGNYAGGDLWYYFTVPANGTIKIIRTHEGNWGHLSYAIYDLPTDTTEVVCGTLYTGDSEIVITGLIPGEMEGLRIWEWGNDDFGTEGICLKEVDTSSIPDTLIDGFSMFPNPVNNLLNIKSTNTINNIHIFNMLGQEMLFKTANKTHITLNTSQLISGSYVVKIQVGSQVGTYQLIKK